MEGLREAWYDVWVKLEYHAMQISAPEPEYFPALQTGVEVWRICECERDNRRGEADSHEHSHAHAHSQMVLYSQKSPEQLTAFPREYVPLSQREHVVAAVAAPVKLPSVHGRQ